MKILIIHASAGAGHTKAAEAIFRQLKDNPNHQVELVNSLDYTPSFYKRLYQEGYSYIIAKFPWLWGAFFRLLDVPWLQGFINTIRRANNGFNAKNLQQFLQRENFDVIVSTHFLANEIAAYLRRSKLIRSKIISVVTDYDVHRIWVVPGIDYYTVASAYTKEKIRTLGVREERIALTGIPTDKKFAQPKKKERLIERFQLQQNTFTVLIATGSFGIGPIEEIAASLEEFQVLIVCGRNQELFSKLLKKENKSIHPFGFVNNMDEIMAVADVMVTKPGGLSISEALVSQLPFIFFNAIPGQETNNVKVLKTYGVGMGDGTVASIIQEIKKLKESPEYLQHVLERIKSLSRPQAVDDIIKLILSHQ